MCVPVCMHARLNALQVVDSFVIVSAFSTVFLTPAAGLVCAGRIMARVGARLWTWLAPPQEFILVCCVKLPLCAITSTVADSIGLKAAMSALRTQASMRNMFKRQQQLVRRHCEPPPSAARGASEPALSLPCAPPTFATSVGPCNDRFAAAQEQAYEAPAVALYRLLTRTVSSSCSVFTVTEKRSLRDLMFLLAHNQIYVDMDMQRANAAYWKEYGFTRQVSTAGRSRPL
jgi:hypothetical protein